MHLFWLGAACWVLAAALLLRVNDDGQQVSLPGSSDAVLPTVCLSRRWLGIPCPGCGLTRSVIYLVHGNWTASWHTHRLGWLMAGIIFSQIPYRLYRLLRPGQIRLSVRASNWLWGSVVFLLMANWIVGLFWR